MYVSDETTDVGESSVTLLESLFSHIVSDVGRHAHVHRLTISGMRVVIEHARGALSEFKSGRSYSGLALNRCAYEAITNVMIWNVDQERAKAETRALPLLAAREEASRVGERISKRDGLIENLAPLASKLPAGVICDLAAVLSADPDLRLPTVSAFMNEARSLWMGQGLNEAEVTREIHLHYNVPSLFVHCRALVIEDIIDTSDDEQWAIRDVSLIGEPNARTLELSRLLIGFAEFIAPHYNLDPRPGNLVRNQWNAACGLHNALRSSEG